MAEEKTTSTATTEKPSVVEEGNEGPGIFDEHRIEDVVPAPQPKLDPEETGETKVEPETQTKKEGEAAGPETKTEAQAESEQQTEEEETAKGSPYLESEVELQDGRKMKVKDVVIAYAESSAEGRSLSNVVKQQQKAIRDLNQQLSAIKLKGEVGEFKEKTEQELEGMSPAQIAKYYDERRAYQERKAKAEQASKEAEGQSERDVEERASLFRELGAEMKADAEGFPDYVELQPLMGSLKRMNPSLGERDYDLQLMYYAAYGRREIQKLQAAKKAKQEAADASRKKAESDAGRTAAPGTGPVAHKPAGKGPAPDSDEAHNDAIVSAWQRSSGGLFG